MSELVANHKPPTVIQRNELFYIEKSSVDIESLSIIGSYYSHGRGCDGVQCTVVANWTLDRCVPRRIGLAPISRDDTHDGRKVFKENNIASGRTKTVHRQWHISLGSGGGGGRVILEKEVSDQNRLQQVATHVHLGVEISGTGGRTLGPGLAACRSREFLGGNLLGELLRTARTTYERSPTRRKAIIRTSLP